MSYVSFFSEYLFPHLGLYFLSLVIVLILYVPIIKNVTNSILDPLFYVLIAAIFANTLPLFLFLLQEISIQKFVYFALSESLFWLSFFFFKRTNVDFSEWHYDNEKGGFFIFLTAAILLCGSQIVTYAVAGIPIFMESRLETYSSGGGIGVFSHIIKFSTIYCVIYSFYLIAKRKRIFLSYSVLFLVCVFLLLSGSKSAILEIFFCYYFYRTYYCCKKINLKKNGKYIFLILFFPIVVLMITNGGDFISATISLFNRFIAYGDVYWLGYPDDKIDAVEISKPFTYLFSRILAPFRIIDYSNVETTIGLQLMWEVNPSQYGVMKGPNARLPILSWVLFRWEGLFLSIIFGMICAWWKTWLPRIFPKGIISVIIYAFLYINLASMFTDPILGTSCLFTFALFALFLLACIFLFNKGKLNFYK